MSTITGAGETMRPLDNIDRAILDIVESAPAKVDLWQIGEAFAKAGIEAISHQSMGYRLRRLHKERRLVYVNMYGDRFVMPMPGKGFRASPPLRHDSPQEGC